LLLSITLPTLSPWGTIAYFHFDRDYIAKVFCENRTRPQLNCNGKCYLAQKLKQQQEKKDKETTERVTNSPVANLFVAGISRFRFELETFISKEQIKFFYQLPVYRSPLFGIIRPPQRA
jgi:hypothetical protein